MLQNRKESLLAIAFILIIGTFTTNGLLDRTLGIILAMLVFIISELFTCYKMKQRNDNWIKEAVLGTLLTLVLFYLLFFHQA